jgi:hypothetical protein
MTENKTRRKKTDTGSSAVYNTHHIRKDETEEAYISYKNVSR